MRKFGQFQFLVKNKKISYRQFMYYCMCKKKGMGNGKEGNLKIIVCYHGDRRSTQTGPADSSEYIQRSYDCLTKKCVN